MKKLLLSLLAASTVSAFADGMYAGVQGDYAYNFGSNPDGKTQISQNGGGFGFNLGNQINKNLGVELGYTFLGLGNLKSKTGATTVTDKNSGSQINIFDAAAVLGYPMMNDKVTPFVKLGLASVFQAYNNSKPVNTTVNTTVNSQYMGLLTGAGVAYKLSNCLSADVHVNYITSATGEYSQTTPLLVGAGATYAF